MRVFFIYEKLQYPQAFNNSRDNTGKRSTSHKLVVGERVSASELMIDRGWARFL